MVERPIEKSKMKKSAIKKWEQSYTVPVPYFGLTQVTRDRGQGHYGNTEFSDTAWFWGSIEKVFDGIPIDVSIGIFGQIEYFDLSNHYGMYDDDITEERYNELKELANNNRSGASVATYSGKVVIRDTSLNSEDRASYYNYIVGTGRDYGGPAFGDFMSINDAIARVGEIVEEFFPKVMEYVNQEKMASTKKSKKAKTMSKNNGMKKSINDLLSVYDNLSTEEKNLLQAGLDGIGTGFWVRNLLAGEYSPEPTKEYDEYDDDDYDASAKKSKGGNVKKSTYISINKRLNKIGGFTKEDEEDDDDKVEVEIEVESEDEDEEPKTDTDEIEEACKDTKSKKTVKGMRANKKRMKMKKEDDEDFDGDDSARATGKPAEWEEEDEDAEKRRKSRKTKKAEDMPADADDFKEDNQKGSGSAGSDMPEDADDNQDVNDPGSGNAGSELPEDADEQQNIKESARKSRIARMQRATKKSVNRPPVKKFSVTPGGQPNQESYNQRYQQAPMVREAIDGHISSRANKSFDEIAMMNERIANLQKSRRNPSSNNGVPKRIR